MKKILFTCLAILISVGLISANPGINVVATAIDNSEPAGGTATFDVSVSDEDYWVSKVVYLYVPDTLWTYSFTSNPLFIALGGTENTDLSLDVPGLATPGVYTYTVNATEYIDSSDPFCSDPDLCDEPWGSYTSVINIEVEGPVSVPEFPFSAASLLIVAVAPVFAFLFVRGRA